MSIWGALGVLFLIVQFVYEQYKKSEKSTRENKKEFIDISDKLEEESLEVISPLEKRTSKVRRIIDKENEIIESSLSIRKDKFIQDFIMAEILSKPKSKK